MKKILLFSILICPSFIKAQIGIGTDTPSPDAVLDVNSTNKGLKLPRLNNTSVVNKPSAGLMIYDKSTNAPAFYDGTKWNSMMPSVVGTDSLTYVLIDGGNISTEFPLLIISMSVPKGGNSGTYPFNITKPLDLNTGLLLRVAFKQKKGIALAIEIRIYKKGTTRHYFSYKFTNLNIDNFSFSVLKNGTLHY